MAWDDLFDDPFAFLRGQQAQQVDAENKTAIGQPLSPDEQQSILQRMLGSGASALSFAGGTLNKLFGGRAIRAGLGMLSGADVDPTELASMIPGSDVLGLTDESHQVTGRKLLDHWGASEPGQDEGFFSPANLAGLGLDIATDPATYLTFGAGAATKAGQAAEKLGILPKTTAARIRGFADVPAAAKALGFADPAEALAHAAQSGINLPDLVGKPLGGVAGLRVPFTTAADTGAILGTGSTGQRIAETIGKPFNWLANTKPAAYLAAQFNPMYRGVTDPRLQNLIAEKAPFAARQTEQFQRGLAEAFQPLIDAGGLPENHNYMMRAALEGTNPMAGPYAPHVYDAYEQAGRAAQTLKQGVADTFRDAGGNLGEWDSIFGTRHAYRAPTPLDVSSPVWAGGGKRDQVMRQLYSGVGPAIQREAMFDLPGGTNQLEGLVKNPAIGTEARTVTPAGRPLDWLENDPRRSAVVESKLSNAMAAFDPQAQQDLMALRSRMAQGPLNAADQLQYDTLRRQFLSARRGTRNVVRSDVLGGYNPRDLSALQKLGQSRPLTAAELDRLDQLQQLDTASRYASGKVNRLFFGRTPLPGQYADAADQVLPTLKGALQDRAAEHFIRGPQGLGLDAERLGDLRQKSGMSAGDVSAFTQMPSAERQKIVMGLTTPGANGRGNAVAAGGAVLTADEANELLQRAHLDRIARPLAGYLGGLNPQRLEKGLFGNDPMADLMGYGRQLIRGTNNASIVGDLLAGHAIPTGPADTGAYGATARIPVGGVMDDLKLDTPRMRQIVGEGMADRGVLGAGVKGLPGDVAKAGVPQEIAEALMQLKPRGNLPEYGAGLLRPFDALTQLTRASITAPWPGFHVRNLTTDLANTVQAGGAEALGWGPAAAALARGEAPASLLDLPIVKAAGITNPQEAAKLVGREAFATGAFGRGLGRLGGDVLKQDENQLLRAIPGVVPQPSVADTMAGKTLPANWSYNPLNIQGLMGQTETRFAPAAWGRTMAELEDTYARGGMFLHGLNQGYTPGAAAQLTGKTVYTGGQFTPFEQNVMRRLFPFWGYTKFVVPQQLQFLAEHPGGLAAQGIRAADAARGQGFLPEYLSNGLAIPIGQEDDGTQRYLSKIDMPWESLFSYVQPGQNANAAVANTGMNVLSQLNPILKTGLEGATNKQFLTGRDLDSLYGGFTGVAAVDNALYNSPVSRAITTARTLTDPRKYESLGSAVGVPLNLMTGAKVTDVDMDKQRGIAQLQALREYLMHDPNVGQHLDFTPKPGQPLTPEEVQVFQLLKTLNAQNQAASRQR